MDKKRLEQTIRLVQQIAGLFHENRAFDGRSMKLGTLLEHTLNYSHLILSYTPIKIAVLFQHME